MTESQMEIEEREKLAATLALIDTELVRVADQITASDATIQSQKELIWNNQRDMDAAEKANIRTLVSTAVGLGEYTVRTRKRIEKLQDSPYFGRVDFARNTPAPTAGQATAADQHRAEEVYIGVHNFYRPGTKDILVHDWRAPVSSLFYDYESGPASFTAPAGRIHGEITGKRQYKISHGRMEYVIESALNIDDEVLQRELSRSADDKMQNIVATIQREQNAIIRNEAADVLILQGVAGSGKTSIALHRVAFLLYRFKDTLNSSNVMILSPNKIFTDYISGVLPELGEEQIAEIDFGTLAEKYLPPKLGFQTFNEQVSQVLDHPDDPAAERMRHKARPEFVDDLDTWIHHEIATSLVPHAIHHRGEEICVDEIADILERSRFLPVFAGLERAAKIAASTLGQRFKKERRGWKPADDREVRKQVLRLFPHKDPLSMYKAFLASRGEGPLFAMAGRNRLEYADVFPLILTQLRTTEFETYQNIRHLLVDEMQDYTPAQYAVVKALFPCRMTILGDADQKVNPFSSSNLSTIREIFPEANCMEMYRSYRSTSEIISFAQGISHNDRLESVDRHGPAPKVIGTEDTHAEVAVVMNLIDSHLTGTRQSLGIVCRTVEQAHELHDALTDTGADITVLDYDSEEFATGVVITSAHIAKGLEFDTVIVPGVSADNYSSDVDRSMLYIACTRAMHELYLTYSEELSPYLAFAERTTCTTASQRTMSRQPIASR